MKPKMLLSTTEPFFNERKRLKFRGNTTQTPQIDAQYNASLYCISHILLKIKYSLSIVSRER